MQAQESGQRVCPIEAAAGSSIAVCFVEPVRAGRNARGSSALLQRLTLQRGSESDGFGGSQPRITVLSITPLSVPCSAGTAQRDQRCRPGSTPLAGRKKEAGNFVSEGRAADVFLPLRG